MARAAAAERLLAPTSWSSSTTATAWPPNGGVLFRVGRDGPAATTATSATARWPGEEGQEGILLQGQEVIKSDH